MDELQAVLGVARAAARTADLSCGGHQPVRAGHHRFDSGAAWRRPGSVSRCSMPVPHPARTGSRRRRRQPHCSPRTAARSDPIPRRSTQRRSAASLPTTRAACAAARATTAITRLKRPAACLHRRHRARHRRCRQRRDASANRMRICLHRLSEARAPGARGTPRSRQRIRHKYRLKNTTGYGLNALIDFDDPVDILTPI
jgi:hypothetical protein